MLGHPVQSVNQPIGPTSPLVAPSRSPYNPNTALHRNVIILKLKNNDASNPANIILSAGRHNFAVPNAPSLTLSDQLIADGANTLTNDNGDSVSVTATAQYGTRNTASWGEVKTQAEKYGLAINALRVDFNTEAQMANRFVFERWDFFGDNSIDMVLPSTYYNPEQYHDKTLLVKEAFAMDQDTIIYYTLDAGESVTMHFYVAGILDLQSQLLHHVRQNNLYSL